MPWDTTIEMTVDDELVTVSGRRHATDSQQAFILVQGPDGKSRSFADPLNGGTVKNVTAEIAAGIAYFYTDQGCDVKRIS